jgi:GWxTD domain-containing protein
MNTKRLILSVMLLLAACVAFGEGLKISVEGLNFFEKDGRTVIDVNYAVKYKNLQFKVSDDNKTGVAALEIQCVVVGQENGQRVAYINEKFTDQIVITNMKDAKSTRVHNERYSFDYKDGGSVIVCKFVDVASGNSYVFKKKLESIDDRHISDIELDNFISFGGITKKKHLIRKDGDVEKLYNSNPARVFYKEMSDSLYCFFQIKDMDKQGEDKWKYNYNISVHDSKNKRVYFNNVVGTSSSDIAYLTHGVYIQDYPNGLYKISINNVDHVDNSTSTTDFSISDFVGEMVSMLPKPNEEYYLMKTFGYDNGLSSWKEYPRSRKIREINKFWNTYSTKMNISVESLKALLKERIDYCNLKYSSKTSGWRSDRGMIYLKYGAPDDIEKFLVGELDATDKNDSDALLNRTAVFNDREYEIWRYTSGRIASYTFFDTKMDNSHKLIYVYNDPDMEISVDWKFYLGQDFNEDVLK